jgi:hypothetical protein
MILGAIGIGIGFMAAPKTIEDVEKLLADSHHGHEAAHVEKVAPHATDTHVVADTVKVAEAHVVDTTHTDAHVAVDSAAHAVDSTVAVAEVPAHTDKHVAHAKAEEVHGEDDHKEHLEHVLHQLQNKPWAALYVACIFFMLISVGVLAFYAIQYAAQAGWSPILFRVMEGITAYLLPGSIIFFVLLVLAGMHFNHLFVWMDPEVVNQNQLNLINLFSLKKVG